MQSNPTLPLLLVVEDDPEVLEAITSSLYDINATIMTAENGKEGVEKVLKYKPQAVMTDISMPVMTGLEMIREIRQHGKETPIVVLSGFGDRKNTTEALRLGAMDFLHKPFEIDDLREVISLAISLGVQIDNFDQTWNKYLADHPELTNLGEDLLEKKRKITKMKLMSRPQKLTG